jgi:hypothetical protein
MPKSGRRKNSQYESAERSFRAWASVFFGVWNAIGQYDRTIIIELMREFERLGLAYQGEFNPELFTLNPSQDILDKTEQFRTTARLRYDLRGKTRYRHNPLLLLMQYSKALGYLKGLKSRRATRNLVSRKLSIKERFERAAKEEFFLSKRSFPLSQTLVEECSCRGVKEIALRVVAHDCGMKPATLKRELTRARRKYPAEARLWKDGAEVVVVES